MARTSSSDELLLAPRLPGEKSGAWLERALRGAVQSGQIKSGVRLPSSRSLSAQYGIARGTVVEVFDQLAVEGYLQSRTGSGTRVSERLPDEFFRPAVSESVRRTRPKTVRLSARGVLLSVSPFPQASTVSRLRAFRAYQPSVADFPIETWARLCARRLRMASAEMLTGTHELGWRPLQQAIAAHLGSTRGVICEPEQVMLVSGTQQALDLIIRLLLEPGDPVWMEDPGYSGATCLFRAAQARIIPIPVDEDGLQVAVGRKKASQARMVYITPANQFPLNAALSLDRRLQLIDWARDAGAWIFEDDYDSEFRFVGRPLPAVQGLDHSGRTLFSCSFNKMLFPALRLGALILPVELLEHARAARSILDRHPPLLDQLVLCDFITEGHFEKHLRKMRQIYAERLATLTEASKGREEQFTLGRCETGLQTTAWLREGLDDVACAAQLAAEGVETTPLSIYGIQWPVRRGLHLGFGAVPSRELTRGVDVMTRVLARMPATPRPRISKRA